jgi:PAS domain S-box-containing protein
MDSDVSLPSPRQGDEPPLPSAGGEPSQVDSARRVDLSDVPLADREAQLRSVFRAAPIGIALVVDRAIVETNDAIEDVSGYSRQEVLGRSARFLYASDQDFAAAGDIYRQIRECGRSRIESTWRRKDGRIIRVVLHAAALDRNDIGRGVTFTVSDITEAAAAHAQLDASRTLLNESQRIAHIGSWELDLAIGQLVWTDECFRIFGHAPNSVQPSLDFFNRHVFPEDLPILKAHLIDTIATRIHAPLDFRIVRADGAVRWIHMTGEVVCDEAGRAIRLLGTQQDTTERQEAEDRLLRTQALVDQSGEVVFRFEYDGSLSYVNDAFCSLTGYSRQEALGMTAFQLNPELTAERWQWVVTALRERGQARYESRWRTKDGRIVPLDLSLNRMRFRGQDHPCGFGRDASERLRAEEARLDFERRLLHAQKFESLGVLAGGIAHDFNNLLMAVLGNLDLALQEQLPGTTARAYIEQSILASRQAADLTGKMLAYSGKSSAVIRPVDVSEIINTRLHLFKAGVPKAVTFHLGLARNLPVTGVDPEQLEQIILNLIGNAADAIGDHPGVISLATGVQDCDEACLQRGRGGTIPSPGRFVYLEVADTGCGMDEATTQRMFDPFFSTKALGRGLGMSAILGIVRAHGGAVFVESAEGRGTAVRVLFAVDKVAESPEPRPVTANPSPGSAAAPEHGAILVVDDEDMVREVCVRMLQRLGWRTLEARNGAAAIDLFRANAGGVAGVILDLSMPGMDGVTVFRELRLIRPDVLTILSSGYNKDQAAVDHLTDEGLAGFIQKPYTLQRLRQSLEKVFRRP